MNSEMYRKIGSQINITGSVPAWAYVMPSLETQKQKEPYKPKAVELTLINRISPNLMSNLDLQQPAQRHLKPKRKLKKKITTTNTKLLQDRDHDQVIPNLSTFRKATKTIS